MQEPSTKPESSSKGRPSDGETPARQPPAKEIGGRGGPEPTRYGDWEINGRCVDF